MRDRLPAAIFGAGFGCMLGLGLGSLIVGGIAFFGRSGVHNVLEVLALMSAGGALVGAISWFLSRD